MHRVAKFSFAVVIYGVGWLSACANSSADEPIAPANDAAEINEHLPLDGDEADDLDALLDLADNDFSQVARVNVSAPSLNMEVTTVSRKKSTVGRSPAAVFVISEEMIRRSGATSIPETLRMAPGVQVAKISSHQWAVSIRGFNGLYSNKLQVQIDGRSVYTPLFGGVFWSAQNIPLTEVERIEIVRGPGGSVWGANAVNGIINIITKDAEKTQGLLVQGGAGTQERGFGTVRYGKKMGDGTYGRVYGNWFERDNGLDSSGLNNDDWRFGRTGFRIDSQLDHYNKLTFLGDYYEGTVGLTNTLPLTSAAQYFETLTGDDKFRGGDVLLRWEHEIDEDSSSALQFYYDRSEFDVSFTAPGRGLTNSIDVFDLDFQHQFQAEHRHSIVWGAGVQHISSNMTNSPGFIEVTQTHRTFERISGFIQDEITLSPEELFFTIGTKVSDNSFSGIEVQPTARLLWLPDDRHSVWASVSRAVRVPTIINVDGVITLEPITTTPPIVFPRQVPGGGLAGNDVLSYEMGIRGQPADKLSWDLTTHLNRYDNLGNGPVTGFSPVPGNPLATFVTQENGNGGSAESFGTELAATYQATPWMKLIGNYSYIQIFGTSNGTSAVPRNQTYFQSSMDLSDNLEGDIIWRYVDNVPGMAKHYNAMDLRLAWKPYDGFEWAIVARNLLADGHREFGPSIVGDAVTGVPTEVYSMITWTY